MSEPRTDQAYVESHESEYITPADAAAAKARADVYNVEQVLHTSGVPLEQIHAAADLNAKNAKVEFEANESADPIRRIVGILETSAVNNIDEKIIPIRTQNLEKQRADWKAVIDQERMRARMQGEKFSFEDTVKNCIGLNLAPTFSLMENHEPIVYFNVLDQADIKPLGAEEVATFTRVKVSDECLDKVLHGLGVLRPDEKTADLQLLPSAAPDGKPVYSYSIGKAEQLPTNIPGAKASLFFKENSVFVRVGVQMLEKIVAFPASV